MESGHGVKAPLMRALCKEMHSRMSLFGKFRLVGLMGSLKFKSESTETPPLTDTSKTGFPKFPLYDEVHSFAARVLAVPLVIHGTGGGFGSF
jgi:hypothetical protein